ncbi:MAG TPA: GAF domain-containing protein [Candidatus Sulfopaludibacter sp.]|jgi:GAF domain-containing protein/CheY-like chemotaxis protein|nr:GAF domain-containing protein [Candidatus Sulfopaludibacter sp.]
MADRPTQGRLRFARAFGIALLVTSPLVSADEPLNLSLREINARRLPDYTAVYAGRKVRVHGIVNAELYRFPEFTALGLQNPQDGGAVLSVLAGDNRLDGFRPGDELETVGTVIFTAGMACIQPDTVIRIGHKTPPAPVEVTPQEMQSAALLGRLVHVKGRLTQWYDTTAGLQVFIDGKYKVFEPRLQDQPPPSLASYNGGDDIEATGVLFQYAPRKPFNAGYELLVTPASLTHRERVGSLPPIALASGICVVLFFAFFLWSRERRLGNQRERLRKTYHLGEEVLGASSTVAILNRLEDALPAILQITRVHLYVHNRAAKTLDAVALGDRETASISLSSPPAGTLAGAVACFHYRTLLAIPDIDRSPFPMNGKEGEEAPKSLLFVPMLAQGEVVGVLELDQDDRVRDFTSDEQALAQHLGNQIGVTIRLLDQRSVQEQLFRTEKLAAVGRLISGVVSELQTPLASISDLSHRALEKARMSPAEREVAAIASEAKKASAMVARLVSFAAAEQVEAKPVSVSQLLRNLVEFREGDWKATGIRVRDLSSREPLFVLGSQGQLEQVFLTLLVHAEQSLASAAQKMITIRTSLLAKRLLVEISFSAPSEPRSPEETAAVLGVTRSVIAGHGGEVRLIEKNNADPRFEIELPVTAKDRAPTLPLSPLSPAATAEYSKRMTALIIEPDEAAQRQLVALLSARGYRVVPVANADAGLDLAHRMRFDAAFCSVHAPGLNWVELSERMYSRVGGFILLSDGYDVELSNDFSDDGRFVLPKPVMEGELERILRSIDRVMTAKVVPIVKDGVA